MSTDDRTVSFVKMYVALLSGVMMFAAGCSRSGPDAGTTDRQVSVTIETDSAFGSFTPRNMSVEVASTVSFVNNTAFPHNVVFADERVEDSSLFSSGETFETRFGEPGVFTYVCSIHPGMGGTITVTVPKSR